MRSPRVEQGRGADRRPGEPVEDPRRSERPDPAARLADDVADALDPGELELPARAAGSSTSIPRVVWSETTATSISSRSSAARRCSRSTRRSSSPVPSGVVRAAPRRNGHLGPARSASTNDAGKRCWMEVEARHDRADLGDELDERLELGQRIARADERDDVAHRGAALAVPAPSRSPRRSHACAATNSSTATTRRPSPTWSVRRRAASGAIVIRSSIPSACRRDELEGDGLGEQARFGGERLGGDADLAQGARRGPGRLARPSGSPVNGAWRSRAALGRARERLREHQAGEIEAVASAAVSKFPTDTSRSSSTTTSGFDWCAFSSRSTCSAT